MLFKEWEILIVDDEPDVLQVSKLAMNAIDVYGLPLKIHTATSKAEALEFVKSSPEIVPKLAVAFVDVVMESDHAGLELCQYIREELKNDVTQLYIRTGQPGVCPEREVMNQYNINGYFSKMEMTEDKLYSLVKSGVRQFLWSWTAGAMGNVLNLHIAHADSREQLSQSRKMMIAGLFGENTNTFDHKYAAWMEEELDLVAGLDADEAAAERDRLNQMEGVALGTDGDSYVQDDKTLLLKIASGNNKTESQSLIQLPYQLPHNIVSMLYFSQVCFASLWKRAV